MMNRAMRPMIASGDRAIDMALLIATDECVLSWGIFCRTSQE
jgi:hypothetical protein